MVMDPQDAVSGIIQFIAVHDDEDGLFSLERFDVVNQMVLRLRVQVRQGFIEKKYRCIRAEYAH